MPLVYQQTINEATRLGIWNIKEPMDFFLKKLNLNEEEPRQNRLQHLAGRYLLNVLHEDFPVNEIQLSESKKPFLPDNRFHFSISHSGKFAAAIISSKKPVGIDIELPKVKIDIVKDKFLTNRELVILSKLNISQNSAFTLGWCIKETMFKWHGEGAVDFKKHLTIDSIICKEDQYFANCIFLQKVPIHLQLHGIFFNGYFLTWLATD